MAAEVKAEAPLYRSIADAVTTQIKSGTLQGGARLPSEAAMAKQWQVSVGTVKRAYAELEGARYIYKIRGGGAYVAGQSESREAEQTPEGVVAQAVRELSHQGLCMSQIFSVIRQQSGHIFKATERICAALVDCNIEALHQLLGNLEQIPALDVEPYLLEELFSGKTVIGAQCQVALVPQTHYSEFIRYADSISLRTIEISLTESRSTVARLAVIPDKQDICVVYRSKKFLGLVQNALKWLDKKNRLIYIEDAKCTEADGEYINKKYPLILPPDYVDYGGAMVLQLAERAKKLGNLVIPFEVEIDEGSLMNLRRILEKL